MPIHTSFQVIFRVLQSNEIHRKYLKSEMNMEHGVKTEAIHLVGIRSYQTLDSQLKCLWVMTEEIGKRR